EETLSTSLGNPCSLARYISPSNSSRTGQKSFSKASRLENIAILLRTEDAMQFSNERLTTEVSRRMRVIDQSPRIGAAAARLQSALVPIQPATARPMARPESSWMKCEP